MELYRDKLTEEYWIDQVLQYGGFPELPVLTGESGNGQAEMNVPDKCMSKLKQLCKDDELNIFSFLFSAFAIVLSRYTDSNKLLILLPDQGPKMMLGVTVTGDTSFKSFFTDNRKRFLTSLKYKEVDWENIAGKLAARSVEINFDNSIGFSYSEPQVIIHFSGHESTLINNVLESFSVLLENLTQDPGKLINEYLCFSPAQLAHLITFDDETKEQSITAVFEERVAQQPSHIALIDGQKSITYDDLNKSANRLAKLLIERHEKNADTPIGIMLGDASLRIVSMLAVLKAGAFFVMIDPVIADPLPELIITDSQEMFRDCLSGKELLVIDVELGDQEDETDNVSRSNQLAFLLYETPADAGVMITHQNIVSLLHQEIINPGNRVTNGFPHYSGMYLCNVLQTLLSGATFIHAATATITVEDNTGLRAVILNEPRQINGDFQGYYMYCNTAVGFMAIDKEIPSRVKPIGNAGVYILNEELSPVPDGVTGEIYFQGRGVSKGFFRAGGLIENPFKAGDVLSRAGVRGKRWPDGSLQFLEEKEVFVAEQHSFTQDFVELSADTAPARILIDLCKQILGVTKIGVADDFFMLGGDSIKAIELISNLTRHGYELDMKDVFSHRIIRKIATCVEPARRVANQSLVEGVVPLTPIQRKFFSFSTDNPQHFNQAFMFRSEKRLTEQAVTAVFRKIQMHHDALRMTYQEVDGEMKQVNMVDDYPFFILTLDFRKDEKPLDALKKACADFHADMDLSKGPLMKVALFKLPDGDRLLISIHHLVIDIVSWKIIFEDMGNLLSLYEQGKPLLLPVKTDAYKLWAERLADYADSPSLLEEKDYWSQVEADQPPLIKKNFKNNKALVKDISRQTFSLSAEETHLIGVAAGAQGFAMNEILLASLGMAVQKCFGNKVLLVDLEKHGRESIFENLNVSRTVGWFTSVYPFRIEMKEDDFMALVKNVSENFRSVPNGGIGYGILKYMTSAQNKTALTFREKSQVSFNYLGEFIQNDASQETSIQLASEYVGDTLDPELEVPYELDISGVIINKMLSITVAYSEKQYQPSVITAFLDAFKFALTGTIACLENNRTL